MTIKEEILTLFEASQNEVQTTYPAGAIAWIDEHCDGLWGKLIERYDTTMSTALDTANVDLAKMASTSYRKKAVELISRFKSLSGLDATDAFLRAVKTI